MSFGMWFRNLWDEAFSPPCASDPCSMGSIARPVQIPAEHNGWGTLPDYSLMPASHHEQQFSTVEFSDPEPHNCWGTMPDYSCNLDGTQL